MQSAWPAIYEIAVYFRSAYVSDYLSNSVESRAKRKPKAICSTGARQDIFADRQSFTFDASIRALHIEREYKHGREIEYWI